MQTGKHRNEAAARTPRAWCTLPGSQRLVLPLLLWDPSQGLGPSGLCTTATSSQLPAGDVGAETRHFQHGKALTPV